MLIKPYITCDQCGQKIYHDDNMIHLVDSMEFDCYYCSLECANKSFNFMGKAEDIDPSLFYDEYDSTTGRPYKKDIEANKNEVKTYNKNLQQVLRDIRAKHDERLYDMAKRIRVETAELSQVEHGHIKDLDRVKHVLNKIIKEYQLSAEDYDHLTLGYQITYKEYYLDGLHSR